MFLLGGDSIAVGLAPYVHERTLDAIVGISAEAGSRRIARHRLKRVVVSLGTNNDPRDVGGFAGSVRRVMRGRVCVVWLEVRAHPAFNAHLKAVRHRDGRLRLVSIAGVATVDGIHPAPSGYRILARRTRRRLRSCRTG